jgi:uncharacterized protein (TIGR03437 family)
MLRKSWIVAMAGAMLLSGAALAGTFGKVVSIGGAAADLALDESRGVLYIANFTANRIEVMSLATNTIQTSINVAAQPSAVTLSPDGHWLLVAHYGARTTGSPTNALTLIDLNSNNAKQTFALGNPPLGAAFGIDNKALVVTTSEFILFDPSVGTTEVLSTIQALAAKTIPAPSQSFPPNIVAAQLGVSADGLVIWGLSDTLQFYYRVATHGLAAAPYVSSPALAPRTVSVAKDGSYAALGWEIRDQDFYNIAQFPDVSGILNVGSVLVDSDRNTIYAHMPGKGSTLTSLPPPVLQIMDSDNLTVREQIQLPENLAGKSVMSSDGVFMYASSDSGITVIPVGKLNGAPRIAVSIEDLVFRGDFCDRSVATKTFVLADPGGSNVPFTIASTNAGIRVSPTSGVTPAVITVRVDPNAFASQKGTVTAQLNISSNAAVNLINSVRILVNSKEPDQRGTFVNIPGKLVDLIANPGKDEFYVLRQDKQVVYVYDGTNNTLKATLRTCTTPMGMAITYDRRYLMVGCDNSHYMPVFDLETFQATRPVRMFNGDYVQSVAASSKAIVAITRNASGAEPTMHRIDLATRSSSRFPALGVIENKVALNTVLTSSPNGATIFGASADGSVYLYDANVDNFTVVRKDFTALSGSYAASAFGQYQVGENILNSSLVKTATLQTPAGKSSGFAFVDQAGLFIAAPDSASPGVIQRVESATGLGMRPTRTAEAPVLGVTNAAFTRSLAPLQSRNSIIALTTSGFTVLPWAYDASVAPPRVGRVVSAADGASAPAPGGLISIYGSQLNPTNLATNEIPVPTALGESCLTVNGQPMPMIFVSPTQINAQMPFQAVGNVTLVVHTPGGVSDNYNLTIQPTAPAVFRSTVAGINETVPAVVRASNNLLVTLSNPVHRDDMLTIYLTGMGQTTPVVETGLPAPSDPLATALTKPTVRLGGVDLSIDYAGLAPGEVGVYQINARVPVNAPQGISVPLTITQGTSTHQIDVRVVQ